MKCDYRRKFGKKIYLLHGELETALLELGLAPHDNKAVVRVIRATRSLIRAKDSVGFAAVADFAGEIESIFDLALSGNIPITWELMGLTLMACDRIRSMLGNPDAADNGFAVVASEVRKLAELSQKAAEICELSSTKLA